MTAQTGNAVPDAIDPESGGDKVVCRECSDALGQITVSHLSRHGMTMEEYKSAHPGAPLQSDGVRERGGWTEESHGGDPGADA